MTSRWIFGKVTLFKPDDPLAPPEAAFDAPWQAQALAMANALISDGHVSANQWAQTLGAALREAEAQDAPDTKETYFLAVLSALETVSETQTGISKSDRAERREAWETAYKTTAHGQPVKLK